MSYLTRCGMLFLFSWALFAQISNSLAPSAAASQTQAKPKFDVASIRPCRPDAVPAGGRGVAAPAATLRLNCVPLRSVIEDAYIRFAGGVNRSPMLTALTKIEGGPGWINSDRYTIEAKSEGAQSLLMKAGPMMQALLEDRF